MHCSWRPFTGIDMFFTCLSCHIVAFFLPSRAANSLKNPYMPPLEACLVGDMMGCVYSCVFKGKLAPTEHPNYTLCAPTGCWPSLLPHPSLRLCFHILGSWGGAGWGHCCVRRPVEQLGGSWDRTASLSVFIEREGKGHLHLPTDLRKAESLWTILRTSGRVLKTS